MIHIVHACVMSMGSSSSSSSSSSSNSSSSSVFKNVGSNCDGLTKCLLFSMILLPGTVV